MDKPQPLNRRDLVIALAILGVTLVAGWCRLIPDVCGVYHDDGIYAITAKALATGEGYRLVNLPGEPRQTKYPPLYPALLAAVWLLRPVFPDNLAAMKLLTLAFGGLALAVAYLYLVRFRYATRAVAAGGALLCATSATLLYFATNTLSELPFALLLVLALWALDHALVAERPSRAALVTTGVLVGLVAVTRSIGVVLLPVALILLRRGRRPVRWTAGGLALVVVPWIGWVLLARVGWHQDAVLGYYTDYVGWWSAGGLAGLGSVVAWNSLAVAVGTVALGFEGLVVTVSSLHAWAPLMALAVIGLPAWISIVSRCLERRALGLTLVAYLALVLIWPWPPRRFLVPLLPLLIPALVAVLAAVFRRVLRPAGLRALGWGALALALVANLGHLSDRIGEDRRYRTPQPALAPQPAPFGAYQRTARWLERHTRPDAVVAAGLDTLFYLYADRRGFRPFVHRPLSLFYGDTRPAVGRVDELLRHLGRADYLVMTPMPGFNEDRPFDELVNTLRARHPRALRMVHRDQDPRFVVYRVTLSDDNQKQGRRDSEIPIQAVQDPPDPSQAHRRARPGLPARHPGGQPGAAAPRDLVDGLRPGQLRDRGGPAGQAGRGPGARARQAGLGRHPGAG